MKSWNTEKEISETKPTKRRTVACVEMSTKHLYRRAYSELQLLELNKNGYKQDHSYHFITGGDVDALSYLKTILHEQNLEHCLFSTWVMSAEDILQFEQWLKDGKIKRLDAYLGEIFKNSYTVEYIMLKDMFKKYQCGRIAMFKNHSKIFAGYGNKYSFGLETSANINTNPRTENACITINKEIYNFYKEYFDGIVSF